VQLEYFGQHETSPHLVDLAAAGAEITPSSGRVSWHLEAWSPPYTVRLQVADRAGNIGRAERLLLPRLFPLGTEPRTPPAAAPEAPTAFSSRRPHVPAQDGEATGTSGVDGDDSASHPAATPWPRDQSQRLDRQQTAPVDDRHWQPNEITGAADGSRQSPAASESTATAPTEKTPAGDEPPLTPLTELAKVEPKTAPVEPPVASRVGQAGDGADQPREFTPDVADALPPGERAILINRLRFPLAYDVEAVGPSGVASVTLWVTRDGGRNWEQWGPDEDRQSPVEVELLHEGVYGFRVVVANHLGDRNDLPQPGDAADVWVRVDVTSPAARITAAPYGVGPEAGHLKIQWEAADENLSDRPVTLLFAADPASRWTTIAAGLPNDGGYLWRVDPHVPQQIYLRLEVRDQAGNVGVHQLSEPINVSGLRPKAHIRGILPLDNTPRGAMLPKLFR
jgi:hypothetical protein